MARRHHLSPADAEEFASLVRFKLVDRDFAILRKFEQRSSLSTYLTVVIERLCLDFCIAKWGKWRPSAAARRLGAVAILLEQLIVREGITFDEAVGTLQTNHGVSETRAELHELLLQLPARPLRAQIDPTASAATIAAPNPLPDDGADEQLVRRVHGALVQALATLNEEDTRILALRFGEGLAVAEIARALGVQSKPLYRRLDGIIAALRAELQRHDVDESEITQVIGHPAFSLTGVLVQVERPAPPKVT